MTKYFFIAALLHLISLLFIEISLENTSKRFVKINVFTSKTKLVSVNENLKINSGIKKIINNTRNISLKKSAENNYLEKKVKNSIQNKSLDDFSKQNIDFKIIKEVQPNYPQKAKAIKYNKEVIIETKFLVDSTGKVKDIIFLTSHEKLGFNNEVRKALKKWQFEPVRYNNQKIEAYFYKKFIFKSN